MRFFVHSPEQLSAVCSSVGGWNQRSATDDWEHQTNYTTIGACVSGSAKLISREPLTIATMMRPVVGAAYLPLLFAVPEKLGF